MLEKEMENAYQVMLEKEMENAYQVMLEKEMENAYQEELERKWGFKAREKALRGIAVVINDEIVIKILKRFITWLSQILKRKI